MDYSFQCVPLATLDCRLCGEKTRVTFQDACVTCIDRLIELAVQKDSTLAVEELAVHVESCKVCKPHSGHMPLGLCPTGLKWFARM